jgi:hypothetical protein
VATLQQCLDAYQLWRDNLPEALADTPTAERLDALVELREHVDALEAAAADLPKGFGRDG